MGRELLDRAGDGSSLAGAAGNERSEALAEAGATLETDPADAPRVDWRVRDVTRLYLAEHLARARAAVLERLAAGAGLHEAVAVIETAVAGWSADAECRIDIGNATGEAARAPWGDWSAPIVLHGQHLGRVDVRVGQGRPPDWSELELAAAAADLASIVVFIGRIQAGASGPAELRERRRLEGVLRWLDEPTHDLKNLFTGLSGVVRIARHRRLAGRPVQGELDHLEGGIERGLDLVRQIAEAIRSPSLVDRNATTAPAAPLARGPRTRAAGRPRALVVDDEPLIRLSIAWVLEDMGADPLVAGDVDEALAVASGTDRLDFVLSEVRLPGGSGADLVHELRRRWPDLAVTLMSDQSNAALRADGLLPPDAHAVDKPTSVDALEKLVRDALGEDGDVADR